jgi:thiamine-monophosphate kinase
LVSIRPAAVTEFELIERFFAPLGAARGDVVLGIGDDAAVVAPPAGATTHSTCATLVPVEGADPAGLAALLLDRALADLATVSAEPAWMTLALTLPSPDEAWLEAFGRSLGEAANPHRIALVGGDTTRGPTTITLFLHGVTRTGAGP